MRFSRLHRRFCRRVRPPGDEMIAFIEAHRDQFAVALICRVLRPAIPAFPTSGLTC
jgi:hypothetical protein